MQLYYIRHAQSSNNALFEETGQQVGRSEDPKLTKLGEKQAVLLAKQLATGSPNGGFLTEQEREGFAITHLYTSLMIRSVQTAAVIARDLGIPMNAWLEVHEEGGVYLEDETTGECIGKPGMSRSYFSKNYPSLVLPEDLGEEGWWKSQPYEGPEMRPQRARDFLDQLIEKHGETDDRVAVISHGGFYNHVLAALQNRDRSDGFWATLYNTGISRIDFYEGKPNVIYMNRVDHLPVDMVT